MAKERNSITVEKGENKLFLLTDRVRTPMSLRGAKLLVELLQENIAYLEKAGFDDDPTAMREQLMSKVLFIHCYPGMVVPLANSKNEKLHCFIRKDEYSEVIDEIYQAFGVSILFDDLPLMTLDELVAKIMHERKK